MRRVLTAVMVLCVWFVPAATAQTTARLPGGRWSFTLPANWKVVDEATLARVNREASGVNIVGAGGPIQYVMMAVSQEGDGCFMMVQWGAAPPPNGTFDGFVKGITQGTGKGVDAAKQALGDKISAMSMSDPEVDQQRERVYLTGQMTVPGVGSMTYLSCPMLGTGETITLHTYAPAAAFEQHRAAFRQVFDSFAFDPGMEYKFATARAFNFGQVGIVGLIGGVAGVAIWAVRKLTGQR